LGTGDPGYTLPAEIVPGLVHERGSLGAVRQGDQVNPERRSNGMQFYIVDGRAYEAADLDRFAERAARDGDTLVYTAENKAVYAREGGTPHLDGAYTVFGKVVDGQEVIDAIAAVPRDPADRPLKDIRMTMRIVE
jgi:peptidyl-prolyl cis-trans isomerase B (cyclophilin B)